MGAITSAILASLYTAAVPATATTAATAGGLTALGSAAAVAGGTAAASAGMAEEGRKSASKAATKARQLMGAESPVAIPETGGSPLDALKRRKKRSGRAATIQAGSLIPESTGTKSLLG